MAHWRCISGCGACCRLDPALRGEDLDCLDEEQRRTYLAMVGTDGWCIHYDTGARRCRIYEARPDFCRVENLMALFAAGQAEAADTADRTHSSADVSSAAAATTAAQPTGRGVVAACQDGTATVRLDPDAEALAIASCRTQIRAEYGGRGRVMKRFEQAIRRTP